MNTRQVAHKLRLSHWAQVMQDRTVSGTSIRKYCESKGIRENLYYYWQRKLREATCNELFSASRVGTIATTEPIAPKGWAVYETGESHKKVSASSLVIEIGEARIIVSNDTCSDLLSKVCKVLVSLC